MARDLRIQFDPQKHHRRSIRLKGYDYSRAGAYFVTIIAHQRECLFGKITNGDMILNDLGKIADECWRAIPEHFPQVELGAHVVMPNHVHGIIVITGAVGARHASPLQNQSPPRGAPSGSLGAMVGSFKSAVTRHIGRDFNTTQIWQRSYHEHIIRDEREMNNIWRYIESNPSMWIEDEEYRRA
jgi:putative transposase